MSAFLSAALHFVHSGPDYQGRMSFGVEDEDGREERTTPRRYYAHPATVAAELRDLADRVEARWLKPVRENEAKRNALSKAMQAAFDDRRLREWLDVVKRDVARARGVSIAEGVSPPDPSVKPWRPPTTRPRYWRTDEGYGQ